MDAERLHPILPPAALGILGGGQLGRMLVMEALRSGYRTVVLTDEPPGSPAGRVADVELNGSFSDGVLVDEFVRQVDVVTAEFENIPDECLRRVASARPLRPGREAIFITQHREREKLFLRRQGIACAPFRIVADLEGLRDAVEELGRPCVIKTAAFGYDGKGQCKVESDTDLEVAWSPFSGGHAVVESWISYEREISVVGARGVSGECAVHGVVENRHAHHILDLSIAPAPVGEEVATQALGLWKAVAEGLSFVGTLAVEMFVKADGSVLVNEIAPRPHNSGHYTLDACRSNQFQQQLRAVCGLPLGDASQHTPAVMLNLLGDLWPGEATPPDWGAVLSHSGARLHLYGKASARARRKMGHVTVLGPEIGESLRLATEMKAALAARVSGVKDEGSN